MRLFLATANPHKVEEVSRCIAAAGASVVVSSATEAGGMPPVEETAGTFAGNARLKAEALRAQVPAEDWVLADDSGIEVEALDGEPGVYSARYAGPGATDADNRKKLLERLAATGDPDRRARFVCVLALLGPGVAERFEGVCPGRIVAKERGRGGFGYDPIFVPDGLGQTFAEVDSGIKDRLSHRGAALREMLRWLTERGTRSEKE